MRLEGSTSSYKGITYNNSKPRFFSQSILGDKSVFSLKGNIYLTQKSDTILLVKYDGQFDPTFGSGYYQPVLDPTGTYALFSYLPGFMNFKEKNSLQKVDIKTKKVSVIKNGEFYDLSFSENGQFLLFQNNERQGVNNTWISDIYILDLATNEDKKIGEAYSASWRK